MDSTLNNNASINNSDNSFVNILMKIKSCLNFVFRIILYAIITMLAGAFLLLILYFVDMFINISNGESKVPLFNAYIIISPSMVPNINVNDAIVVKRVSDGELKVDDVITFTSTDKKYSGLTITHRIVGTETLQSGEVVYRTKGDANNVNDSALVSIDNIHGKVILRIPLIGHIQSILSSSSGWLFFIVIPALGIIAFDIFKLFRAMLLKKKIINDEVVVNNNVKDLVVDKNIIFDNNIIEDVVVEKVPVVNSVNVEGENNIENAVVSTTSVENSNNVFEEVLDMEVLDSNENVVEEKDEEEIEVL